MRLHSRKHLMVVGVGMEGTGGAVGGCLPRLDMCYIRYVVQPMLNQG